MFETTERLARQLQFIVEIDELKQVLRQTRTIGNARRENSAEHSWQIALMALILAEYAPEGVDPRRVMTMLLLHDLVEIDAGDTFCYDADANLSKAERELAAAERIFGLLPGEQGRDLRALWEEFEAVATPDSRYANAMDRLAPLLLNYHNGGGTWKEHSITRDAVERRMAPIRSGAPALWPYVLRVIDESVAAGYIREQAVA